MQNVVVVSATAENLRIQRFSRCCSAAQSPLRFRLTLAHATRKLTMRIVGLRFCQSQLFMGLRSTFVLTSIRKTTIRSNVRLKLLRDATCGLGFTPAFAPIAVRVRCHRSGWPSSGARHPHGQARDSQGDQFETMPERCRHLSRFIAPIRISTARIVSNWKLNSPKAANSSNIFTSAFRRVRPTARESESNHAIAPRTPRRV